MRNPLIMPAVLVLALVSAAGCTSSSQNSGTRSSSAAPSSAATTSATPPTPSSSSPSVPGCATRQLALSAGDSEGAAGSSYDRYVLVNHGASCTLTGFPGVSFLDAAGTMIGEATRSGTQYATVTLPPGQPASFVVHTSNLGVDAGCSAATQTTTTLQVYPPNQTTTLTVATKQAACRPIVGPVQLGTQATP